MFNTYQSKSLRKLADHFSGILETDKDNPLSKPWIIVQNNEIKEWLSLRIAENHGIAGNFNFIFPSEFLWTLYRLYKGDIPQVLPSDLNSMHWALFELFSSDPELLELIPFYNTDTDNPKKRFQLCGQLADIFDQYQVYRPDMMEKWRQRRLVTKEPNERWELSIWNRLNEQWQANMASKELPNRAEAYAELITCLEDQNHSLWSEIPEDIYVFGLSHLSQPFSKIISRIGKKNNLHLFTLQLPEYSSIDKLSKLIEDWGKPLVEQGFLLEQLLNQEGIPNKSHRLDVNNQHDFPELKIHSCHNVRREVQVLKDEVLRYLDANPESKASDILIMVPDAEAYSGIIETIFDEDEGEPALPVSRVSSINYHSAAYTLASLLELLSSSFKTSAVLQLLNHESIKSKFSISDPDVELIEEWVRDNRIYWGIGEDFNTRYSWQKGLNQILAGFSLEPEELDIYKGLVPYSQISSSDEALLMARFSRFVHALKTASGETSKEKKPTEWIEFARVLVDNFLGSEGNESAQIERIRRLFEKLKEQALFTDFRSEISFGLVKNWLISQLSSQDSTSGRFGQGITVSSYVPYRSVPFHFIGMLGMNESVFPRKTIRPEFDLIYADPKPGDRILKEDDSYLFLESIQAAQNHLHISYKGQDQHSDSIRLPSILVQQLLDVFNDTHSDGIIRHSLHPFNKQYFDSGKLRSYSDLNKHLSEKMQSEKSIDQVCFINDKHIKLQHDRVEQIHLSDLISFFTNPSKYVLRNFLSLSNYSDFIETIDREPFQLDSLDRYKLDHLLFENLRKKKSTNKVKDFVKASALIPEAMQGEKAFEKEVQSISVLLDSLDIYTKAEERSEELSIECNGIQLYGTVHGLFDDLLVSYRVGKRRAEHEVGHWIKHLILLYSGYDINKSLYFSKDGIDVNVLEINSADIFENPIDNYLEWFMNEDPALKKAAFFPQTSKAYAEAIFEGKEAEEAVKKANSKWKADRYNSYAEETDYFNSLVWRGYDPVDSNSFKENAVNFWKPFLLTQKRDA